MRIKKKINNPTPGLIFYDTLTPRHNRNDITKKIVSYEKMHKENPHFTSHGQKREYIQNNQTLVLRQGRYFHTLETFTPYVQNFDLIDSYITQYDEEDWFLSVLLQKPRTAGEQIF